MAWAKSDKLTSGGSLGEWIYGRNTQKQYIAEEPEFTTSLSPNAKQKDWKTPTEFPLCPKDSENDYIVSYKANLKIGEIFSHNRYSTFIIDDFAISKDRNTLWVMCKNNDDGAVKPWSLAQVSYENKFFIHKNLGSFFKKDGAEKQFTIAQGLEWTGGETFDDFT